MVDIYTKPAWLLRKDDWIMDPHDEGDDGEPTWKQIKAVRGSERRSFFLGDFKGPIEVLFDDYTETVFAPRRELWYAFRNPDMN